MTATLDLNMFEDVELLRSHFIEVIDTALLAMGERDILPKNEVADILIDARNSIRDALA